MSFGEWVDKNLLAKIAGAIIVGLSAASVRAIREREGFKAFLARMVAGGLMAGIIGYALSETDLGKFPYGMIMFAMGWGGSEIGALIFTGSKKSFQSSTGIDITEDEKPTTHEPDTTDKPAS